MNKLGPGMHNHGFIEDVSSTFSYLKEITKEKYKRISKCEPLERESFDAMGITTHQFWALFQDLLPREDF